MNITAQDGQAIAILAVTMPLVVSGFKRVFPGIDARLVSIGLCALVGLFYALAVTFVPQDILMRIATVGGIAWATGTAMYKLQQ